MSSIGRLDKDTTGLILVTDQTRLMHTLTSPVNHVEKTYRAFVNAPLTSEVAAAFASGTLLLDSEKSPCLPAKLEILDERTADITITEGRYHQVRRMFAAVGFEVMTLNRWRFGEYLLESVAEGEWKDLPIPK